MFEKPLFNQHIWQNIINFSHNYLTNRLWAPCLIIIFAILTIALLTLSNRLKNIKQYHLDTRPHQKLNLCCPTQLAAATTLLFAFLLTAGYLFSSEQSLFNNFDLMAIHTTRAMLYGLTASFDYTRLNPLAGWPLVLLYAISNNFYIINLFILLQLAIVSWLLYLLLDDLSPTRRLIFLTLFMLSPSVFSTNNIIFYERELLIALTSSLLFIRQYCRTSKLKYVFYFLFFMNVAIYTKENTIIFYTGILITSLIYNIWNEKISLNSFLHPFNSIKAFPIEFLTFLSLCLFGTVYSLLVANDSLYLKQNQHSLVLLFQYYIFEILIILLAATVLFYKLRQNLNTKTNPCFNLSGFLFASLVQTLVIIFILKTAPSAPHLWGRTYYLQLSTLFATAYLIYSIHNRLILCSFIISILCYSSNKNWELYQSEVGKHYRTAAEFLAQQLNPLDNNHIYINEYPTTNSPHPLQSALWQSSTYSSCWKYYLPSYHITFYTDAHLNPSIPYFTKIGRDFFFPLKHASKPSSGNWIIQNKLAPRNNLPPNLPKAAYSNDLFEIYYLPNTNQ